MCLALCKKASWPDSQQPSLASSCLLPLFLPSAEDAGRAENCDLALARGVDKSLCVLCDERCRAVVAKALIENPHAINWALTPRALLGLLALLCGNGYIVGINQIYDTDIDK